MMRNSSQPVMKPFKMQPKIPSAAAVVNSTFFLSLWSASTPKIGPKSATTTVTTATAME